jgi:hypothetical protein
MRWTLFAASASVVLCLWLPGEAAPPTTQASPAASGETITFEQYRDWRLHQIERRQTGLTARLAVTDLPEREKSRLAQTKSYYDWLASLPDAERDRRFRERFDRIDTNHDGQIDAAERAAWRDKQRAFYPSERRAARPPAEPASVR